MPGVVTNPGTKIWYTHPELALQEFWPSGENGTAVTMGDYVRDVFLEQVMAQHCTLISSYSLSACACEHSVEV